MAEMWKPQPLKVYLQWLKTIADQSVKLNEWEATFVTSLQMRLDKGINLTQLQAERLESIYAERTR